MPCLSYLRTDRTIWLWKSINELIELFDDKLENSEIENLNRTKHLASRRLANHEALTGAWHSIALWLHDIVFSVAWWINRMYLMLVDPASSVVFRFPDGVRKTLSLPCTSKLRVSFCRCVYLRLSSEQTFQIRSKSAFVKRQRQNMCGFCEGKRVWHNISCHSVSVTSRRNKLWGCYKRENFVVSDCWELGRFRPFLPCL